MREETSPEDIKGMNAAEGILTARGGMTSHAALVARQMGKVCIVGCEVLRIEHQTGQMIVTQKSGDPKLVHEGDWVSIDGSTGEVIEGRIATKPSEVLQVLLDKSLDADAERGLPALRDAHGVGRQGAAPEGARERRPARPGR